MTNPLDSPPLLRDWRPAPAWKKESGREVHISGTDLTCRVISATELTDLDGRMPTLVEIRMVAKQDALAEWCRWMRDGCEIEVDVSDNTKRSGKVREVKTEFAHRLSSRVEFTAIMEVKA